MKQILILASLCLTLASCEASTQTIVNEINTGSGAAGTGNTSSSETNVELADVKVPLSKVVDAINAKDKTGVRAQILSGSEADKGIIMVDIGRMIDSEKEFTLVLGKLKETSRDKTEVSGVAEITFEQGGKPLGVVEYTLTFQQVGNDWKISKFEDTGGDRLTVYRSLQIG